MSVQVQIPFEQLSGSTIYALRLESIAPRERISDELAYRLVHLKTGLRVPGAFSEGEALTIQKITLDWDWQVDKSNKPACCAQLLHFLEQLCKPSGVIEEIGHYD